MNPITALAEVDNFMRVAHDGNNPLTKDPSWEDAIKRAKGNPGTALGQVGEDSGLCDAALFAGARMYVDTDLVVGHVTKKVLMPDTLKENMERARKITRFASGVYE
jgi:hypothetical protein